MRRTEKISTIDKLRVPPKKLELYQTKKTNSLETYKTEIVQREKKY
jgi:hypothetical protein